jgi:hypothetical protein
MPTTLLSPLLTTIDAAIATLKQRIKSVEAEQLPATRSAGPGDIPPSDVLTLDDLELFLVRMQQIRDLLQADPRLVPVVDEHLGQQLRMIAAETEHKQTIREKRSWQANVWLAIVTMIIGTVLGWLIALAFPIGRF